MSSQGGWWHAGEKDVSPDAFYLNALPYSEDMGQAKFPSFKAKPELQPEERHIDAMVALVEAMDLSGLQPCSACSSLWVGRCRCQQQQDRCNSGHNLVSTMPCMPTEPWSCVYQALPTLQVSSSPRICAILNCSGCSMQCHGSLQVQCPWSLTAPCHTRTKSCVVTLLISPTLPGMSLKGCHRSSAFVLLHLEVAGN